MIVAILKVYVPNPTSLGQYVANVTAKLAHRGHRTSVYMAKRAAMPREGIATGNCARSLIADPPSKTDICPQFCGIVYSASPTSLQDAAPNAGYAHDHRQFEQT